MTHAHAMRPPGTDQEEAGGLRDADLIARWRDGDERAASLLVGRHLEPLTRFVSRIGSRDEVDDVVQETFIKAFGAIEGFRADSAFRTWLFTIARRLVVDRGRAAGRRGQVEPLDEEALVSGFDPLDDLVASEQAQRLRMALDGLTPMQRAVFLCRVQDGLGYRDLADRLGTTEGAARVHYHNAVKTVKEFLHG